MQAPISPERPLRKAELVASLPPEWPEENLLNRIQDRIRESIRKVVVLDDDPTGTQTVADVPVFAQWSVEVLQEAFARPETVFYILTNSRSQTATEAVAMNREVAANLAAAAKRNQRVFDVVSRSDSTLRGHYPAETRSLKMTLEDQLHVQYDGEVIAPFFLEGGRFTAFDIHWVQEGEWLTPAAQTEYARDPVFGYRHSNLRDWIEEKTKGRVPAGTVVSITLDLIRSGGPSGVASVLKGVTAGRVVIVNAVTYRDMEVFVLGLLEAEKAGKRFISRTAASFVKVRAGIPDSKLLTRRDLFAQGPKAGTGGLVIVGSYVQKTTDQLQRALKLDHVTGIELNVASVLKSPKWLAEVERVSRQVEQALGAGHEVIIYTSRKFVSGLIEAANIQHSQKVSEALVQVVRGLRVQPRFVVAKGGITSSDIATQGLGVTRAIARGQILPGVPVWMLGEESRFSGIPYVIFPGNVGGPDSLAQVIKILQG